MSQHGAATLHGVPKITLQTRLYGHMPIIAVTNGRPLLFTADEELRLENRTALVSSYRYGYSRSDICNIATDYAILLNKKISVCQSVVLWLVLRFFGTTHKFSRLDTNRTLFVLPPHTSILLQLLDRIFSLPWRDRTSRHAKDIADKTLPTPSANSLLQKLLVKPTRLVSACAICNAAFAELAFSHLNLQWSTLLKISHHWYIRTQMDKKCSSKKSRRRQFPRSP